MAKIKIDFNVDEILDSQLWKDKNLNLMNRGMLITLIAIAKDNKSIISLSEISGLSEWTIRVGLNALEQIGYLTRSRVRRNAKIDWDFVIKDHPTK